MTPRTKKLKVVAFTFGTFGGIHWYGTLSGVRKEQRVEHVLGAAEARLLDEQDDWNSYKAGDESERFQSRKAVVAAAKASWRRQFRSYDLLVDGWHASIPTAILDGEHPMRARLEKLLVERERIRGTQRGMERMRELVDEWWELVR